MKSLSIKKQKILNILKANKGQAISGIDIGENIGISRAMVWKYIKSLKNAGYEIESIKKKGYILKQSPDFLYPEEVKNGLKTTLIGKNIYYFEDIESTNLIAKQKAHKFQEGTVIIAETQYSGYGRMGRTWESPAGGIWFSIILKPVIPLAHLSRLTIMTGNAVMECMKSFNFPNAPCIKWPNDILINGKKVCGILTEVNAELDAINFVIIGIGINANNSIFSPDIEDSATSLKSELGISINRIKFLQNLLFELEQEYIKLMTLPFSKMIEKWTYNSETIGKQVVVRMHDKTIEGVAIGLSDEGGLIIEKNNKEKVVVLAGDCLLKYD